MDPSPCWENLYFPPSAGNKDVFLDFFLGNCFFYMPDTWNLWFLDAKNFSYSVFIQ
jgi:hypothetical protein